MHAARNDSHQATRELWFTFMSDRAQRDFALAYLSDNKNIKGPIRRALNWSICALNELSTMRNDAAHTDMIWVYEKLEPGFLSKEQTRKRLEDRPFDENWRLLKGDFSALSNYLMDLSFDILFENTWPSAKKPKLRLARSEDTKKQARNRRAKRKAQQHPHRS